MTEEAPKELKVTICSPVRDLVHSEYTYSVLMASMHLANKQRHVKAAYLMSNGTVLQEQRTDLAKKAIAEGSTWVIFVDTDMRFPPWAFEHLLLHKKPIVAANYVTRKFPWIQPISFRNDEGDERVYTRHDSTGLEEVASTGFGLIAIHKTVFETMPQPWFYVPFNPTSNKFMCGEDIFFCKQARKHGFKVYIDHDLSKHVGHIGSMTWAYDHGLQMENSEDLKKLREHTEKSDLNGVDMSGQQKSEAA